ncbi:hypothetical protein D3C77_212550 [compost metagenome]
MGRRPMAVRRCCSQSGDGPFCTPRITRPAKTGHRSASSILTDTGEAKVPATGTISGVVSSPRPAAARSRAMPATPSQSGRFGVTSKSITGSAPKTPAAGVPTCRSPASSRMPSASSASSSSAPEHSMPWDTTPRTGFSTRVTPRPGT